jgi:homoserine kinase
MMPMTPRASVLHHAVRVPATTANLGPGFDALGAAVGRWLVAGSTDRQAARVTTSGEGAGEVATDDDNLVWQCLVRFCATHDVAVPDVSLRVTNDIPLERGLGSSSAAIVAGLALGRALTGTAVGDLDLVRLAAEIEGHPDNVAPAVLGGFVSCATTPAGDLVVRRAQPAPTTGVVVAVPGSRQATSEARAALPAPLPRGEVAVQAARASHVTGAFTGLWPGDPALAGDVLHEPPRLAVMRASGALLAELRDAGVHAWLSGAGPTVAAVVPLTDEAPRDLVIRIATAHGFDASALDWDLAGSLVCPDDGCAVSGVGGCATCPRARL